MPRTGSSPVRLAMFPIGDVITKPGVPAIAPMAVLIEDRSTTVPAIGDPCAKKTASIAEAMAARVAADDPFRPVIVKGTVFGTGAHEYTSAVTG